MQEFLRRNPLVNALLAVCMTAGGIWALSSADFNENILDILPERDRVITQTYEYADIFGQNRLIFVNISSECGKAASESAAEEISDKILKIEGIKPYPADAASKEDLLSKAISVYPYFFDRDSFEDKASAESMRRRLAELKRGLSGLDGVYYKTLLQKDPLGLFDTAKVSLERLLPKPRGAVLRNGRICTPDFKNLLLVFSADFDPADSAKSSALMEKLLAIELSAEKDFPGINIDIYGGHRISADNAKSAKEGSSEAMFISAVLIIALCFSAFRHRIFALYALFPSLLGVCMAFVFLRLVSEEISSISIAFASIAIGISIDYAIHILYAADGDEGARGILDKTQNILKPILIAASTTIIAFAIIPFMGGRSFGQLGIFGAAGVFFSAAASLTMLPALISRTSLGQARYCPFYPVSETIWRLSNRRGKACACAFACMAIIVLPFLKDLRFEGSLSSFSGVDGQTQSSAQVIRKNWSDTVNSSYIILRASSLRELMDRNKTLLAFLQAGNFTAEADSPFKNLESYDMLEKRRQQWAAYISENIRPLKDRFAEEARRMGIKPSVIDEQMDILSNTPSLEDFLLNPLLFGGRVAKEQGFYALSTNVTFRKNADKQAFYRLLEKDFPDASLVDTEFLGNHMAGLAKRWLAFFSSAALAAVVLHLVLTLRSLGLLLCVLVPVASGIGVSLAILSMLGEPITLINAIFIIFAICIAQDYAVFLSFAKLGREKSGLRAVALSAFTTTAAFGALAVADHPVLKGIGLTSALSIFLTFLASICLVPALFDMLVKKGRRGGE